MENTDKYAKEIPKEQRVLTVCGAGAHRSLYMAEILRERGYIANNRGVANNFAEEKDLWDIGMIVFASPAIREIFEKKENLMKIVGERNIELRNINVTQSDDDKAQREKNIDWIKEKIAQQLDDIGLNVVQVEVVNGEAV